MHKFTIKRAPFTLAILAMVLSAIGAAQQFDLLSATYEGTPLCELQLDDVTGQLGRPSSVEAANPILKDILGPTIAYHDLGIRILFGPGVTGREPVQAFTVHLTRTWDQDSSEWFQPFLGVLTPPVTPDWRVDRTLTELSAFDPIDESPEYQEAEWDKIGLPVASRPTNPPHHVRVRVSDVYHVVFTHEPVTRFLERVGVVCQ